MVKVLKFAKKVKSFYWTSINKFIMGSGAYGRGLKVNGLTHLSRNTKVGNNCNFNGLIVSGGGEFNDR